MKATKKQKKANVTPTTISNNTFTGVHWDAEAIESVNMVAKAVLNLTELFRAQNIQIDSMIKVESNNKPLNKK